MESREASVNIAGADGITRSDMVFTPVPPPNNNNNESSSKAQGKQVVNDDQGQNVAHKATLVDEVG